MEFDYEGMSNKLHYVSLYFGVGDLLRSDYEVLLESLHGIDCSV